MPIFKKESLEVLRQRIDLVEVLGSHLSLHRSGSSYKALCPFHEERTPSFIIQKGDTHYHCFGCGAHGDAIAFLMGYLKLSFVEAVEMLAERFGVSLETSDDDHAQKGPSKTKLKEILEKAAHFYHFSLLYTEEGKEPLQYLFQRGIDLDFIRHFHIGYAAPIEGLLQRVMQTEELLLEEVGLLSVNQRGRKREFFFDRIMIPVRDASHGVIGFSARKFKESTFGGKYINTPETALFKKSHVLFGLHLCRRRIAKERRAIIVEGQLDALRLIEAGFNVTVAGQGTAFGTDHVKELLHLGVNHVFLALDGDTAGVEASIKIGDLFQKEGVEVTIVQLEMGSDPDTLLREEGTLTFLKLLEEGIDYLTFLVRHFSKIYDTSSPAGKNELVLNIAGRIRKWDHPLMVHESLRKLAGLTSIPELMIGVEGAPKVMIKRKDHISPLADIDPDRVLETDLLRWLLVMGESVPKLVEIAKLNLSAEHFRTPVCKRLFAEYMQRYQQKSPCDFLSLAISLNESEDQLFLSEVLQKKINRDKAIEHLIKSIKKILERKWMEEREVIKNRIQSASLSDEEALALARTFDEIKKRPPAVISPDEK